MHFCPSFFLCLSFTPLSFLGYTLSYYLHLRYHQPPHYLQIFIKTSAEIPYRCRRRQALVAISIPTYNNNHPDISSAGPATSSREYMSTPESPTSPLDTFGFANEESLNNDQQLAEEQMNKYQRRDSESQSTQREPAEGLMQGASQEDHRQNRENESTNRSGMTFLSAYSRQEDCHHVDVCQSQGSSHLGANSLQIPDSRYSAGTKPQANARSVVTSRRAPGPRPTASTRNTVADRRAAFLQPAFNFLPTLTQHIPNFQDKATSQHLPNPQLPFPPFKGNLEITPIFYSQLVPFLFQRAINPQSKIPQSSVPHSSTPQSSIHGTTVPQTSAISTPIILRLPAPRLLSASQSTFPQTSGPQLSALQSSIPQSSVPQRSIISTPTIPCPSAPRLPHRVLANISASVQSEQATVLEYPHTNQLTESEQVIKAYEGEYMSVVALGYKMHQKAELMMTEDRNLDKAAALYVKSASLLIQAQLSHEQMMLHRYPRDLRIALEESIKGWSKAKDIAVSVSKFCSDEYEGLHGLACWLESLVLSRCHSVAVTLLNHVMKVYYEFPDAPLPQYEEHESPTAVAAASNLQMTIPEPLARSLQPIVEDLMASQKAMDKTRTHLSAQVVKDVFPLTFSTSCLDLSTTASFQATGTLVCERGIGEVDGVFKMVDCPRVAPKVSWPLTSGMSLRAATTFVDAATSEYCEKKGYPQQNEDLVQ
ncbi:MAG: hypothetical protein J3R72DRAFT_453520 [Linnemannia gamsii]|nr:MAG: hypothetical protein J3R72DRAFT_453520 [Linnemannia gamsii]